MTTQQLCLKLQADISTLIEACVQEVGDELYVLNCLAELAEEWDDRVAELIDEESDGIVDDPDKY